MRTNRSIALVAAVLLLPLVGCASIPDTGNVRAVKDNRNEPQGAVLVDPPGPTPNATPAEIVSGFLDAMLAYPVSDDTASEYLTSAAARKWRSSAGATIYTEPRISVSATNAGRSQVGLTVDADARLSAQGRFDGTKPTEANFGLEVVKVDGEWRIDNPPDGLLIRQQFFDDYYQSYSSFFFDGSGRRLIADPVHLPAGDQLATGLVTGLLRGPEDFLGGRGRTFLPKGTSLAASVPVRSDGTAEVNLSGPVDKLSVADRERLSAQVVTTLGQVAGVTGVRILVDGTALDIPGVDEIQPATAWDEFESPTARTRGQVFALRNDKLVVIGGTDVSDFLGAWGKDARGIVDFRVDTRLRRIAAVLPGRRDVLVSSVASKDGTKERTAYSGTDVLKPAWDADGRLWVLDRGDGVPSLSVIDDKATRDIKLGGLAGKDIVSFELSPDNARFVAVARDAATASASEVYVGTIQHGGAKAEPVALAGTRALPLDESGLDGIKSAAWRSPTAVVVLGHQKDKPSQPYIARIDGSTVIGGALTNDPLLPEVGARAVLGAGILDAPIYVSDDEGRLWLRDLAGQWQRVTDSTLRVPSFPG